MPARFVGYDGNRARRVYGDGPSAEIAETEAMQAAKEYVAARPDTGPLSSWIFMRLDRTTE